MNIVKPVVDLNCHNHNLCYILQFDSVYPFLVSTSQPKYFHRFICFCMCADVPLCVMCAFQDLLRGRIQMKTLTNKWYEEVRQGPSGSEDDEDEAELL